MKFDTFMEIELGGDSLEGLLSKLKSANIHFNEYAKLLFKDPEIIPPSTSQKVNLVKVSPDTLGFSSEQPFHEIEKRASESGLNLCPLYTALYLRLSYLDQKEGPYLHVASKKTKDDINYPNGLYIRNYEDRLWLRGFRADDLHCYPLDWDFIFLRK